MVFPTRQTFFTDQSTSDYSMTVSWTTLPGLVINLTTQTGDSLELSFTCLVTWQLSSGAGILVAQFEFAIDGFRDTVIYVLTDKGESTGTYGNGVAYRYLATGLAPGAHNITVEVVVGGSVSSCTLKNMFLSVHII